MCYVSWWAPKKVCWASRIAQLATAAKMFCPWANCSSWPNKESEILCTHDNAVYKVFCYQNIKRLTIYHKNSVTTTSWQALYRTPMYFISIYRYEIFLITKFICL